MASSGVNVLRYTALGLGGVYGVWHQSTITAKDKLKHIQQESQRQSDLVEKAKAEYVKKNSPPSSQTEGGGVITDPDDSRFDLEAYLTMKAAE